MRLPRDTNRQFAGQRTGAIDASLEVLLAPEFSAAVAMAALLHFTGIERLTEEEEGRTGRRIRIFIWRSRSYPDLDSQTRGPSKMALGRNNLPAHSQTESNAYHPPLFNLPLLHMRWVRSPLVFFQALSDRFSILLKTSSLLLLALSVTLILFLHPLKVLFIEIRKVVFVNCLEDVAELNHLMSEALKFASRGIDVRSLSLQKLDLPLPSPGGDMYSKRKSLSLPRRNIRRHFCCQNGHATPRHHRNWRFLQVSSEVDIRVRQIKPFKSTIASL